jgi:hypothetical protein
MNRMYAHWLPYNSRFLSRPAPALHRTDGREHEMPLTVQEELSAEFTRQTGLLESTIEQLKMEKEGSQQAFDKYRWAGWLAGLIGFDSCYPCV